MPRLPRVLQKIFGGALAANPNVAQIGSLKAGAPQYTTDLAVMQALSNYEQGFQGVVVGTNSPAIQDMTALLLLVTKQLKYLFQQGIPEWIATETYYVDQYVSVNGVIYISKTDNNIGNLVSDTNHWKTLASTLVGSTDAIPKAWVTFDGFSGTIYSQFNVSSISKVAVGVYDVNFNNPLANGTYSVSGTCGTANGQIGSAGANNQLTTGFAGAVGIRTTTQVRVYCHESNNNSNEDCSMISVQICGTS